MCVCGVGGGGGSGSRCLQGGGGEGGRGRGGSVCVHGGQRGEEPAGATSNPPPRVSSAPSLFMLQPAPTSSILCTLFSHATASPHLKYLLHLLQPWPHIFDWLGVVLEQLSLTGR